MGTLTKKTYTKISEVRNSFWDCHPCFKHQYKEGKRQNQYSTEICSAFVEHVDNLYRSGMVTTRIADVVTL